MTERSGGTVLVVAKAPRVGHSKTRLVPPLEPGQAAALHEALLLDTIDHCRAACADVRLLCPPADVHTLERLVPGVPCVAQQGRGLADALQHGLAAHAGPGPCAIVSSDVPGLPAGSLAATFALIANGEADVVLGPALDGGYWLIATGAPQAAPFREIPWSTPAVAAVTRARCVEAGLTVAEVALWRDVDTMVDLAALTDDASALPARTRAALESLDGAVPAPARVEFVGSELLAGSPWRAIIRDRIVLDGRETEYGYLGVPRAVFVAAVTSELELLLVRQYRHPVRDWTIEVPAGSVEDGETPLDAAKRELREEVGGTSERWTHLTTFFSSSAHVSLRSDAFLARDVVVGAAAPGADEALSVVRMPLADAIRAARAGRLPEGQTALTLLLAAEHLDRPDERSTT